MLQTVVNTMATHHMLDNCNHLIVGVSGGADSVCLLSVLYDHIQKNHLPIQLYVAHVNHCLRGEAADADEAQVNKLCAMWQIPLQVKRCNVEQLAKGQGVSVEMAGRTVRYAFFQEMAAELPNCKIAVAHNKDDRAETVLWNMIRGTGTEGLKGIPYVRENIIRPLLDVSKEDIRAYCAENNLPVCEDASNQETIYSRNKIRLELIPYMNAQFDTDITEKIIRMSDNISCDDAFLQEMTEQARKLCVGEDGAIDVEVFLQQHMAIQIRVLQQCCGHQLQQVHLQMLLPFLKQNNTGKKLSLPGNLVAKLQYGKLYIQKQEQKEDLGSVEHTANGIFLWEPLGMEICCEVITAKVGKTERISNRAMEQLFDYDLLLEKCENDMRNLCVRTRREGDFIRPFKGNGSKSLKRFFIDKKIPREKRDTLPLLVIGQEVLWVMGYCRCNAYLPTEETKKYFKVHTKFICN